MPPAHKAKRVFGTREVCPHLNQASLGRTVPTSFMSVMGEVKIEACGPVRRGDASQSVSRPRRRLRPGGDRRGLIQAEGGEPTTGEDTQVAWGKQRSPHPISFCSEVGVLGVLHGLMFSKVGELPVTSNPR